MSDPTQPETTPTSGTAEALPTWEDADDYYKRMMIGGEGKPRIATYADLAALLAALPDERRGRLLASYTTAELEESIGETAREHDEAEALRDKITTAERALAEKEAELARWKGHHEYEVKTSSQLFKERDAAERDARKLRAERDLIQVKWEATAVELHELKLSLAAPPAVETPGATGRFQVGDRVEGRSEAQDWTPGTYVLNDDDERYPHAISRDDGEIGGGPGGSWVCLEVRPIAAPPVPEVVGDDQPAFSPGMMRCPDCHDGGACLPGGCGIDDCPRCGKPCPSCNGSCEVPDVVGAKCPECKGSRIVYEPNPRSIAGFKLRTCSACHGTGQSPSAPVGRSEDEELSVAKRSRVSVSCARPASHQGQVGEEDRGRVGQGGPVREGAGGKDAEGG